VDPAERGPNLKIEAIQKTKLGRIAKVDPTHNGLKLNWAILGIFFTEITGHVGHDRAPLRRTPHTMRIFRR